MPFRPASDSIAKALSRFRRDILDDQFNISTHANLRMTQRGIPVKEILECVRDGQPGAGKVVEDFIGGCFYHKGLYCFFYAPYGDHTARPNLVTLYREGEEMEYNVEDLIQEKVVTKIVEKIVKVDASDLSLEDLMALVQRKTEEKAEAEKAQKEARKAGLIAKRDDFLARIAALHEQLKEVNDELRSIGAPVAQVVKADRIVPSGRVTVQPHSVLQICIDEPVLTSNGKLNILATLRKHNFSTTDTCRPRLKAMCLEQGVPVAGRGEWH